MKAVATLYCGSVLRGEALVTRGGDALPPRRDLRNHSPTGYSWGYGGSGPSQLSLAILADFLEDDARALQLYQPYKWRVIAQLPQDRGFRITGAEIADVVAVLEQEMRSRT